jgi:hypothetical protein
MIAHGGGIYRRRIAFTVAGGVVTGNWLKAQARLIDAVERRGAVEANTTGG